MKRIERRTLIGAGLATALIGRAAAAQTFPTKQIRWIIPFAPGGNYDVTSRIVAEPMGRQLGQSILIDNKPGAGASGSATRPSTTGQSSAKPPNGANT